MLAVGMGEKDDVSIYEKALEKFNHLYLFGKHTYWRSPIIALMDEPEKAVGRLNELFALGNRFGVYFDLHYGVFIPNFKR